MRHHIILFIALTVSLVCGQTLERSQIKDKIEGMWLGQIVANMAGRSTEGSFSGSLPNPAQSVDWIIKNPTEYWPGDDDTDIEYIAIHIFENYGTNPFPQQIAAEWLSHITSSGIYISNRQARFLMEDGYLPPQTGSRNFNMHWYSIDSQITTEIIGAIFPGLAQQAIDTAFTFASISNEGFPVHASQFYCAMYANSYFESDIRTLIETSLNAIPVSSRSSRVITDVLNWYDSDMVDGIADWRATRRLLYDYYGGGQYSMGRYYNWIESTVNLGATVMCLLYGNGDYKQTVQIGILAGWDCDCNPATAGGILGIINGRSNLPQDLFGEEVCSSTYKNIYRPGLPTFETVSSIANRVADLIENNILANGGSKSVIGEEIVYTVYPQSTITGQPEKLDPSGPQGLIGQAIANGIDVTVDAAVKYTNTNNDRYNIYSIIDGINDNSYNGVRPYWSYGNNTNQDWYSITFSKPVNISSLCFYEGDLIWTGINTYVIDDISKGGYFQDIAVEVLKDGSFVSPAGIVQSEPLSREKMYQCITFSFDPVITQAVRIIGTPGGSQGFTTILELEPGGSIETGLYVESCSLTTQPQRSVIADITVGLSEALNANCVNDIKLINKGSNSEIDVEVLLDAEHKNIIIRPIYRLADGNYTVEILCSSLVSESGNILIDDDRKGVDGIYKIDFHSLFGDIDGNTKVDNLDFALFAQHWQSDNSAITDSNDDGLTNFTDLLIFMQNWLSPL